MPQRNSLSSFSHVVACAIISIWLCVIEALAAETSLQKVRVGYVSPSTDNVLVPLAQKQGFFRKRGIESEIITLRGGVQMAQALLSDSLQFAQMAGSVLVRSVQSGADLVMIASYVDRISYFWSRDRRSIRLRTSRAKNRNRVHRRVGGHGSSV
jgi:ABC-type nitrate/sulfonate/bicarbonate transport system substrate-binding protein